VKFSIRSLLQIFAICLALLDTPCIAAVILPPPPPPDTTPPVIIGTDEPTPTPTPAVVRPTATVNFSDSTQISTSDLSGRFRLVGVHLNEVINIIVRFPAGWANAPLAIQSLDGGYLSSAANTAVAADGAVSLCFQAGNSPGLYRVALIGAGGRSMLQFWVPDANNPQANRPVVNPGH